MVKNIKIAKGILYLTENWLSRNEKDLDSNFNLVIANIQFFWKLPQISHFHKNGNFKILLELFRPSACTLYLYPINVTVAGGDM